MFGKKLLQQRTAGFVRWSTPLTLFLVLTVVSSPSEAALTVGFDAADEFLAEFRQTTFADPEVPAPRLKRLCTSLDSPTCFDQRNDASGATLQSGAVHGTGVEHPESVDGDNSVPSPTPRDSVLGFLGHYETPGAYAFRAGDVLIHRGRGDVGIVVERCEECQIPEEWIRRNFPAGMRKRQPFYSILVSKLGFTRHGAQSSHRLWDVTVDGPPPQIEHPEFRKWFSGKMLVEHSNPHYRPRNKTAAAQKVLTKQWDQIE